MSAETAANSQFAEAHCRLIEEGAVQLSFSPQPVPPQAPEWLRAIGRAIVDGLQWIGQGFAWLFSFLPDAPVLRYIVIVLLAVVLVFALYTLAIRLRGHRLGWRRGGQSEEDPWQPDAAPARRWLDEAEALASKGLYAEAVHHLLFRSIADIERRRPDLVRPASTSRDIAAAPAIPDQARGFFGAITDAVEGSLFGGRALQEGDWHRARKAYENFALKSAWQVIA